LAAVAVAGLVAFSGTARGEVIYGATVNDFLVSFDSATPADGGQSVAINGLDAGEHVIAMDLQPGTQQLFALGSNGRLYTLDAASGQASFVGRDFGFALNGANGGMAFNRADGHLHIVSSSDHSVVVDTLRAETMLVGKSISYPQNDASAGMDPNITQISSTAAGQLYGIDTGLDQLVTFGTTEDGQLHTIGQLGIDATESGGFAISPYTGLAFAAFRPAGASNSNFYQVDLASGQTSLLGGVNAGGFITSIAVAPEPASALLVALGAAVLARRRMKR
jgi:hypothetical protein